MSKRKTPSRKTSPRSEATRHPEVQKSRAKRSKRRGHGPWITAVVIGGVGVAVVLLVMFVFALGSSITDPPELEALKVTVDTSAAGGAAGTREDPLPFDTSVTAWDGTVYTIGLPTTISPSPVAGAATPQYFWSVVASVTIGSRRTLPLVRGFTAGGPVCTTLSNFPQPPEGPGPMDLSVGDTSTQTLAFRCAEPGTPELELFTGSDPVLDTKLYYAQ